MAKVLDDESSGETDENPKEGVMTTQARGKGFTDRHRDRFLFRF